MKYKPYSPEWTRHRELKQIIYEYLEDPNTEPSQICEDIRDVLFNWIEEYSSRAEKGKELRNFFKS
jgi:hypothetical protein